MTFFRSTLLATALAAATLCAQAATVSFESFSPPNNTGWYGIANGGQAAVTSTSNNYYIGADRSYTAIGGINSQYIHISADGRFVNAAAPVVGGTTTQAAIYDATNGQWTTLGGLGAGGTGASNSTNISADGSTAVGYASVLNGTKTINHAAIFKNGTVVDLSPTATSESRAMATNADGTLSIGYVNGNTVNGTLWKWNASTGGYDSSAITGTNGFTGAAVSSIGVSVISANGQWAAGDSTNAMAKNFGGFASKQQFFPTSIIDVATGKASAIPFDHVLNTNPGTTDIDASMKAAIAGIGDNGAVIGQFNTAVGFGSTPLLSADAFIYFATTGQSYTFDSYLDMLGVSLSATQHVWSLYGMSADGDSISGIYFDSATNKSSTFLLNTGGFIPSAVPEPGQWALLALGLPLLLVRRARRKDR